MRAASPDLVGLTQANASTPTSKPVSLYTQAALEFPRPDCAKLPLADGYVVLRCHLSVTISLNYHLVRNVCTYIITGC